MYNSIISLIKFINLEVPIKLYPYNVDADAQDEMGVVTYWGSISQQSVVKYTTVTVTIRSLNSKTACETMQQVIDYLNWQYAVDLDGLYIIQIKATDAYPRFMGQDERRRFYYSASFYMLSGIQDQLPYIQDYGDKPYPNEDVY